ncbi:hypothetical protein [Spirosoma knui]
MKILCSLVLCLLPMLAWAGEPTEVGMLERKKTIIKMFDVDANDNLSVDNQFGQVSVGLWDKNEIRVQITITANSDSDERVQRYLDAVSIEEKRVNNQIILRTHFSQNSVTNWSVNNWKNDGERNFVKINYDIMMPKQNALSVRNKFGNTSIPAFHAPLTVYNRYGNFNAEELTNRQNDIDVAYGKAYIRNLDQGKLDIAYATLDLTKANVLTLSNKFGKMNIGDVGKLNADINYSGAKIGTLRESARVNLDFSGGFRIEQFTKTTDAIDIVASYSSVALPVAETSDCDFNVTVSYGGFNYPNTNAIRFTSQPDREGERYGPRTKKQYSGKIGSGNGPKIRVVSSFGSVNFK